MAWRSVYSTLSLLLVAPQVLGPVLNRSESELRAARSSCWSGQRGRDAGLQMGTLRALLRRRQALLQIGDDVVLVLEADREAHHVGAGAGLHLLRVGELAVRRRGRMD